MALNEIKKQVVLMLQSVSSLDSSQKLEVMTFLKDCASDLGLKIPDKEVDKSDNILIENEMEEISESVTNFMPSEKTTSNEDLSKDLKSASPLNNATDSSEKDLMQTEINAKESEDFTESNKAENLFDISCENSSKANVENNKKTCKSAVVLKTDDGKKKSKRKLKSLEEENQENDVFKCPGCTITCKNKSALLVHFTTHPKVPMSCRLCRSNFSNVLHFWRHQKKKECKLSLFECVECNEKFKYRRHYLKHVLGHSDNNCRYCDEKFSTWLLYKHHLKKNHPNIKMERDLIPCKFCAMSFRRHLGLYNHYQLEHSKGKFVCLSCGLLLPTKEKYKEHALVHESEKLWKCKICKMKFYRRQQLLFHVSVHKSGTYKCLTCDITVTSKADLYKHKKNGHEVKGLEPKFKCEICHKNFKRKVVLKNHMATHSKEKEFYCTYCVKSFSTLDALQKHQKRKSHFEKAKIILPESKYEKVYEDKLICESCGKQYKTQRELTWHLRVHKSLYECDECGKTFTLKVNLTKHIKLHRNKVCVVCELCGNTFNQLSALNDHNLMKHSDVRNVKCEVCEKKFKRKSELNRHMRIHQQKRPFVCFCGTSFNQSSHLQTHYKTFHDKPPEPNNTINSGNFVKSMSVNGEQGSLLSLDNVESETNYRSTVPYSNIQVNENHDSKVNYFNNSGNYVNGLRYIQNEMDQMNVSYEDISFGASQPDKREMVFTSPAVDLSMVTISEVVQENMALVEPREVSETDEHFNKMPEDASSIQLVNLSEHIVQEYLLNLP